MQRHDERKACELRLIRFLWTCALALSLAACDSDSAVQTESAQIQRPNFLLIVADDLGQTDLGYYGSEINTPNIDRLAENGLVLTNFYTTPLCAPTRSELLSGTDHHRAGEGMMQVNISERLGYEGRLNHRVVSLATRLADAGYHTYMSGKWHLGSGDDEIPSARGFEKSFALLDGGASHFADQVGVQPGTRANYRDEGEVVEQLPADFYSTDYYTDRMLDYLRLQRHDGQPFFAYLTYTAPHWPLQIPTEDIDRYRGHYDAGYEVLRSERFKSWQTAGLGVTEAQLPDLPPDYVPWAALSENEKGESIRAMEVYAAMVDRLDRQIGRVIDYLSESGELENTVVIFQSDNGAESGVLAQFAQGDNRLENIGLPGSWTYLGPGWAEAGSAPFYRTKGFAAEGGIHVPGIVYAPGLGLESGRSHAKIVTYDIAPTLLELAGVSATLVDRPQALPITGRSFAGLFRGDTSALRSAADPIGREHAGHAALIRGDWKILWEGQTTFYQGVKAPGPPPMSGVPMPLERFDRGSPAGSPIGPGGSWRLFNLGADPAEKFDVSTQHPDIRDELLAEWDNYVSDFGVIVKSGEGAP
jgi:arylsulfatase A-like enzyme